MSLVLFEQFYSGKTFIFAKFEVLEALSLAFLNFLISLFFLLKPIKFGLSTETMVPYCSP